MTLKTIITHVLTILIFTVGSAQATLIDRSNGLIYDDVLDITWLQNVNLGAGSTFDDGSSTTDGRMTWDNAVAWADDLSFGGLSDWRLASMDVNGDDTIVDCDGASEAACRDNELGYMFYQNLMGTVFDDLTGNQFPFENIGFSYWSSTEFAPNTIAARNFPFINGIQGASTKIIDLFAWAVRPGDVSASVPEPSIYTLLSLGLLGLWGSARRKH